MPSPFVRRIALGTEKKRNDQWQGWSRKHRQDDRMLWYWNSCFEEMIGRAFHWWNSFFLEKWWDKWQDAQRDGQSHRVTTWWDLVDIWWDLCAWVQVIHVFSVHVARRDLWPLYLQGYVAFLVARPTNTLQGRFARHSKVTIILQSLWTSGLYLYNVYYILEVIKIPSMGFSGTPQEHRTPLW